jgi:S-disulfanyl-L-cysteine oxidoreductase SoxD
MRKALAAAVVACTGLILAQAPSPKSVWDGAFTDDQVKRGEKFSNDECATCHGDGLSGGEEAPSLVGAGFLSAWTGLTVGDLFDRIRKTMPQDNPNRLSRQQVADIVAYLLSVNRFPAGKTELPVAAEVLREIKIDAKK